MRWRHRVRVKFVLTCFAASIRGAAAALPSPLPGEIAVGDEKVCAAHITEQECNDLGVDSGWTYQPPPAGPLFSNDATNQPPGCYTIVLGGNLHWVYNSNFAPTTVNTCGVGSNIVCRCYETPTPCTSAELQAMADNGNVASTDRAYCNQVADTYDGGTLTLVGGAVIGGPVSQEGLCVIGFDTAAGDYVVTFAATAPSGLTAEVIAFCGFATALQSSNCVCAAVTDADAPSHPPSPPPPLLPPPASPPASGQWYWSTTSRSQNSCDNTCAAVGLPCDSIYVRDNALDEQNSLEKFEAVALQANVNSGLNVYTAGTCTSANTDSKKWSMYPQYSTGSGNNNGLEGKRCRWSNERHSCSKTTLDNGCPNGMCRRLCYCNWSPPSAPPVPPPVPPPASPPATPPTANWFWAGLGDSCDAACAAVGLTCDKDVARADWMPLQDTEEELRALMQAAQTDLAAPTLGALATGDLTKGTVSSYPNVRPSTGQWRLGELNDQDPPFYNFQCDKQPNSDVHRLCPCVHFFPPSSPPSPPVTPPPPPSVPMHMHVCEPSQIASDQYTTTRARCEEFQATYLPGTLQVGWGTPSPADQPGLCYFYGHGGSIQWQTIDTIGAVAIASLCANVANDCLCDTFAPPVSPPLPPRPPHSPVGDVGDLFCASGYGTAGVNGIATLSFCEAAYTRHDQTGQPFVSDTTNPAATGVCIVTISNTGFTQSVSFQSIVTEAEMDDICQGLIQGNQRCLCQPFPPPASPPGSPPPPAAPFHMHTCEPSQIVHPMQYTYAFCQTMNAMYGGGILADAKLAGATETTHLGTCFRHSSGEVRFIQSGGNDVAFCANANRECLCEMAPPMLPPRRPRPRRPGRPDAGKEPSRKRDAMVRSDHYKREGAIV